MTSVFRTFADGVHAVVIQDDLAVLDTRCDAYLCLPGAAGDVVSTPRGLAASCGPAAARLQAAGLLGLRQVETRPPGDLPSRSAIRPSEPAPWKPADLVPGWGVVRDVRRARAEPGLKGFLSLAGPGAAAASEPAAVVAAARRFHSLSPWLPVEGQCLVRSAMLISYLRRAGLGADWVFAVRLWPFSAHCWVQHGDVCLNDDVERLAAYTPIFVT